MNMNTKLTWNPKFKILCLHSHGIILLSQTEELFFPNTQFPLFHLIDGKRTQSEIISHTTSPMQASTFLYLLDRFQNDTEFLINTKTVFDKSDGRGILVEGTSPLMLIKEAYFSTLPTTYLNAIEVIINKLFTQEVYVNCIFVADLLDLKLKNEVNKISEPFCLILINETECKVTPIFKNIDAFIVFQQHLIDNKPVIRFLDMLFPENNNRPPVEIPDLSNLEPTVIDDIVKTIHTHIVDPKHSTNNLLQYHFKDRSKRMHLLPGVSKNFTTQTMKPLKLQPCISSFNKDGGSRSVAATETVAKLMPFVSPITGLITHIEELKTEPSYPIKIYRTAFFKTPTIKDSDNLDNNSFVQICLGKGVTHAQSQASALCEAIERRNAQYQGNETLIKATATELEQRYINFHQLMPYSDSQYARFNDPNDSESKRKQAVIPYNDETVHWLPSWSLTHDDHVYVPLTACFANIPFSDDRFGRWHSNGCAAGNNLEETILQALFELIERDATAIWWYNRLPRPSFDLTRLDQDYFTPLHQTISNHHNYWVLDLTVDIGIPVMAAIGRHKQTQGWVFGFGCHLKPEMAAQRALTELCQLIPIRDQNAAPFNFNAITNDAFLNPQQTAPRANYYLNQSNDLKTDILAIVKQLKRLELETLVLDYSRAAVPITTIKAFVPSLCHIWPQLANPRLYDTPVKLGWLSKQNSEATINQQGLYI